jgi:hypothetical protein
MLLRGLQQFTHAPDVIRDPGFQERASGLLQWADDFHEHHIQRGFVAAERYRVQGGSGGEREGELREADIGTPSDKESSLRSSRGPCPLSGYGACSHCGFES